MGDWGFKISKPGVDVGTATKKDLVFTSNDACFKIAQQGMGSISALSSGSNYLGTIAHSLSFPILPLAYVWIPANSTYRQLLSMDTPVVDSLYVYGDTQYDSSNCFITVSNGTGSALSTHYYYYLCYA